LLVMITGGAGSGKTSFALQLATTFGHTGMWLVSRWPDKDKEQVASSSFVWKIIETDPLLPEIIDTINVQSNPYTARNRVLVIDSIAVWLYGEMKAASSLHVDEKAMMAHVEQRVEELVQSILAYQGAILVITNEMNSGWDETTPHLRLFHHWLPAINARLAARCKQLYLLTSGIAVELLSKQVKFGRDLE